MSQTAQLLHIVINTHCRQLTIPESTCQDLYSVIANLVRAKHGHLYCINGIGNHLHLLVDLHTTISLAEFMRHIKQNSSMWMKRSGLYPSFDGWGKEYFAASVSPSAKENVIHYIINQKTHHLTQPFETELQKLILNSGKRWEEYMLT